MKRAAFTLMELLIVVAVLAVLAALLFPVIALARQTPRGVSCLNNLKQLGNALTIYRQDYDQRDPGPGEQGHCPGAWSSGNQSAWGAWYSGITTVSPTIDANGAVLSGGSDWVPCDQVAINNGGTGAAGDPPAGSKWVKEKGPVIGALFPYVKNAQLYICPVDAHPKKLLSYSMNAPAGFITDTIVQRPGQFITLIDEQFTLNDGFFWFSLDCPSSAHTGGFNVAFYDGHVSWLSRQQNSGLGHCSAAANNLPPTATDKLFCPYFQTQNAYNFNGYDSFTCKTQ